LDWPLSLPAFGLDRARVSGYTVHGFEAYARCLIPLETDNESYVRWSAVAAALGISLSPLTSWDDLKIAGRSSGVSVPRMQRGTVDSRTIERLIAGLGQGLTSSKQTYFALWDGYAAEVDGTLAQKSALIPIAEGNYLQDGSFRLFKADLTWVRERSAERGVRFPVAMWAEDGTFVWASALYQDSWYVSCGRAILDSMRGAGLDCLDIDRKDLLPSMGD